MNYDTRGTVRMFESTGFCIYIAYTVQIHYILHITPNALLL